ncbi:unnamed protein product [Anisakis simplex]|uniref:O-phosphoseryl-tRNA(Sec) selenium transferase n=1 Tax=Anisakis simplex TaxID=6269 RepID=A0A0M3K9R8_ANISI|nr:unnamed protein product [Anisakis simplex]
MDLVTTNSELIQATNQKVCVELKNEESAIERSHRCSDRTLAVLRKWGQIPENGLPEVVIRRFLTEMACCDTNNRYDRIFSLSHGMGRSGNLIDQQPKAIGSSMLARIANSLALDAIRFLGIPSTRSAIVFPVATGMSLAFCLSAWRSSKPQARCVVFLRIDQLSCIKSIFTAGYEPIVIDCIRGVEDDDLLSTDLERLSDILRDKHDKILAVISTTSCFAPRGPDDLVAVGQLCSRYGVRHLVNNAYGLQSLECRQRIQTAGEEGHIDAFVQSLDKNFLVPVGGSVIAGFSEDTIQSIAEFYPGRASLVPSRDLLITLLQLGRVELQRIYTQQSERFKILCEESHKLTLEIGETVLKTSTNLTSIAITLNGLPPKKRSLFGSILFDRGITGARVVCPGARKTVFGHTFVNYGTHWSSDAEQLAYLNVACAIGMSDYEVHTLIETIRKEYEHLRKECSGNTE